MRTGRREIRFSIWLKSIVYARGLLGGKMLLGVITPVEQATVLLSPVPLILHMFRRSDDHHSSLTTVGRNEYPVFLLGGLTKDAKALLTSTSGLLTYIYPTVVP